MTRCKNCGGEIIRFLDRWAHVGDEGVLFSQCRITRAEPEEVEPEEPEKVGFVYKPYEYGTWTVPARLFVNPVLTVDDKIDSPVTPHRGYIEITTVRGDRLLVNTNNIVQDGVQVDIARRRGTVEFAATGVRLLKREEVEGSDQPD